MNYKILRMLVPLFIAILASGCANIGSLKPGEGTSFYVNKRSYEEVWQAAIQALQDNHLTIVEKIEEKGIIKAENPIDWFSWGEVVGIFLEKNTEPGFEKIKVEVISLRKVKPNSSATDWTSPVIDRMKQILKL